MAKADEFVPPVITDEDIEPASTLLGLPAGAFDTPRRDALKNMGMLDVAACPGSGKTTLLVAKLAILAEKWQDSTRGICVLSHTNAAREEIEKKLGNTTTGRKLLSYPHFIGTIHGFINEFLAIPWLQSLGYSVKMIDTEVCYSRRWHYYLNQNTRDSLSKFASLSVKSPDFDVQLERWGKIEQIDKNTNTYRDIQKACKDSADDGYFCHDEMFIWADELIKAIPSATDAIRDRFPILLIDEAQDNSETQSAILNSIFMAGEQPVIRQRFGDGNQAIYDFQGAKAATTDKFPNQQHKIDLPNSHRFGQKIADLANPLGLVPQNLKGLGANKPLASGLAEGQHTIFIFNTNSAQQVLNAYGALLAKTFSNEELREGHFYAVGQVHKSPPPDEEKPHKFPHHLGHYWKRYESELNKLDPKPKTFTQYLHVGQGKLKQKGENHVAVEKSAQAFLELANRTTGEKFRPPRQYAHRYILQQLQDHFPKYRKCYQDFIVGSTIQFEIPSQEIWEDIRHRIVKNIAVRIAKSELLDSADDFLIWDNKDSLNPPSSETAGSQKNNDNVFHYSDGDNKVAIQMGSIHSVKGQTHTATLVLETFFWKHNLKRLLPWLSGDKGGWFTPVDTSNLNQEERQNWLTSDEHNHWSHKPEEFALDHESRLKLHYVAMTRPTHLLCLAMRADHLTDEETQALKGNGWHLVTVLPDGSTKPFE